MPAASSADFVFEAVIDERVKVGSPAAEVIVHVDYGDYLTARVFAERRNPVRHRQRKLEQLVSFRELQIVDDVDQQDRDV